MTLGKVLLIPILGLSFALGVTQAQAKCKGSVSASAENYREKEDQAREDAVSAWEDKVRNLHGKGWAYWTKAENSSVTCVPLLKSSVLCTAKAKPCFYELGQ
jgi:hypothetical protein